MAVYHFDEIDWHVPVSPGTDPEKAAEAGRLGAGRKFLAQGDGGFYAQIVRIPPNFEGPSHSHDHAEVFMLLAGELVMNGEKMAPRDMTVIPANVAYGFTTGPEGAEFLVIRTAKAAFQSEEDK